MKDTEYLCKYCNKKIEISKKDIHENYCIYTPKIEEYENLIPCEICGEFIEFDNFNSHMEICNRQPPNYSNFYSNIFNNSLHDIYTTPLNNTTIINNSNENQNLNINNIFSNLENNTNLNNLFNQISQVTQNNIPSENNLFSSMDNIQNNISSLTNVLNSLYQIYYRKIYHHYIYLFQGNIE